MSVCICPSAHELDRLYHAGPAPELVWVPELTFLMVGDHGDPNGSPEYMSAIQALYLVSYILEFALKRTAGLDSKVAPLEPRRSSRGRSACRLRQGCGWSATAE